jgi:hypothetical protein
MISAFFPKKIERVAKLSLKDDRFAPDRRERHRGSNHTAAVAIKT